MRRFIISMVITAIAAMGTFAQNNIFNNPDNKAYFGLRAGGEITCPGNISVENIGLSVFNKGGGFEIGTIYNIPVVANFYVEPGMKFFYNTYSLKSEWVGEVMDDIFYDGLSIRKFGMRVPVMAGYRFDFTDNIKVSVFTGPELEVGFWGEEVLKGPNIETSGSIYDDGGGMNRVNLLWDFGAGISYDKFYFEIKGGIGMLNMLSDSVEKFRESRVTFSVGYNF